VTVDEVSIRSCRVVRAFADVRARVQTHSRRDGRCHTVRLVAGGFFGPTPEFDAFVAEYISPVMREAGFKQAGFRYTLRGDDKSAVVVGVRLHTPAPVVGFMIRWAAIPRVLREFYVSQNPNWRPADKWGLVSVDTSPPRALWSVDYRTNVWQYAPDSPPLPEHLRDRGFIPERVMGEGLRETLSQSLIPKWRGALSTEYLRTIYKTDEDLRITGDQSAYAGPTWLTAILGADEGDPAEATAALDLLEPRNPGNPIIPWLRARLAARIVSQASPS
jgi:hypothetical protein